MSLTPWDGDTHFRIEDSDSPITVDDYALGEPKRLVCEACGASVILDPDLATPGIDDLEHASDCPNRFARSEWFRSQL